VLAAAVASLELVSYFSAPRHQHPTLSSLYDAAARHQALRAAAFAAWLRLGLAVVRR
jgi:hypothetical protein